MSYVTKLQNVLKSEIKPYWNKTVLQYTAIKINSAKYFGPNFLFPIHVPAVNQKQSLHIILFNF